MACLAAVAWITFVHCNKYVYSIKYLWRIQEQAIGYQHMDEMGLGDKKKQLPGLWYGIAVIPPSSLELAFSL